eukprot:6455924-Amphidinium_carterae.1
MSGGHVVFSSLNVGCLSSKLEGLVDLGSDFVALQEVGIPKDGIPSQQRFAKSLRHYLSFGPCPTSFRDTLGRLTLNRSLGVAVLASNELGCAKIDADFPTDRKTMSRLASWQLKKGEWECIAHVAYFKTGGSAEDAATNDTIMACLLRRLELKSGKPQLVAGDFQGCAKEFASFLPLFQQGWLSAVEVGEIQFTHTSHTNGKSLIDDVLMCPLAAQSLSKVQATEDAGFSTHSLISITFVPVESEASGW